jgi:glycosyltransferase involved in cell wall biosynthesis
MFKKNNQKKQLSVLVIEPCFVNYGGYFRSYNLSLALSKKGIKVDLLVSSRNNFQLIIKKTKFNENFCQYELPRINIYYLLNGRLLRGLFGLIFGLFGKYDIVHACVPTQLEANIPAFFLKLFGKKVVMDWDDYWLGSPIFKGHKWTKKYINFCEKRAPKYFKNMVVTSEFLKKKAEERGAANVIKIINGVNTNQFVVHGKKESRKKLELDKNGKYLLTFGNSYANDRALLLFQTFEHIQKINPGIKLLFNFDPYKLIKEQGLENKINMNCLENIINVGYINQEDLGYYLGAADATIFLQGETEDEIACFSIRVGSYLNGESIIIINDVNSEVGNTLKLQKCVIIEKDIKELAKKTVDFLNNTELQNELKRSVIEAKKNLSWDNLVTKLIDFYKII